MAWDQAEPSEAGKKRLASSIIGKEGETTGNRPAEAEEDSEPDNDGDEAPQHKIERMVLERAHNGYVLTHHYQQPEPAATPEAMSSPEHKRVPPKTHVFKHPEELHNHVGKMLKHVVPAKDGLKGGREY
jgi:hypothetical protein